MCAIVIQEKVGIYRKTTAKCQANLANNKSTGSRCKEIAINPAVNLQEHSSPTIICRFCHEIAASHQFCVCETFQNKNVSDAFFTKWGKRHVFHTSCAGQCPDCKVMQKVLDDKKFNERSLLNPRKRENKAKIPNGVHHFSLFLFYSLIMGFSPAISALAFTVRDCRKKHLILALSSWTGKPVVTNQ